MAMKVYLDVNDTIINTLITAFQRNNYVLKKLDLPLIKFEEFKKEFGVQDFNSLIFQWTQTSDTSKFMEIYDESRKVHKYQSLLSIEDVENLSKKFDLSIITETSEKQLTTKFKEANLDLVYFKNILCSVNKEKIVDSTECSLESTRYYIGDSKKDYFFALKNNMEFIAVETGKYNKQDFIKIGCSGSKIFSHINEVKEYLIQ